MQVQRYEKNGEQRLKNRDFLLLMPIASLECSFSHESVMNNFAGERHTSLYRRTEKIFTIFCMLKCDVLRCGTGCFPTPPAKIANTTRGVCNFPMRSCPSPQAEFCLKTCFV